MLKNRKGSKIKYLEIKNDYKVLITYVSNFIFDFFVIFLMIIFTLSFIILFKINLLILFEVVILFISFLVTQNLNQRIIKKQKTSYKKNNILLNEYGMHLNNSRIHNNKKHNIFNDILKKDSELETLENGLNKLTLLCSLINILSISLIIFFSILYIYIFKNKDISILLVIILLVNFTYFSIQKAMSLFFMHKKYLGIIKKYNQ